jgi:intein/homing endonuclease
MDIQDMIQLYNEGKSLSFIANKYNMCGAKIKKILIDNGIKIRTRAEQNKITNQERGKKVNHTYFDNIDTYQKAWLLGFLAADGSVASDRNRIKIGLSSVDREILEKIQKELNSEREILDYETNQGFQISELSWSSENHKHKLVKYDIVPNKTYKGIRIPQFENDDFKLAYILGYYDGDGCFKNDGTTCRFEICSYDKTILEDFAKIINQKINSHKEVYKDSSRENYYTLTYSTKDVIQILDSMYQIMNKTNSFYLQRKYNKYIEWKKQNNRI